MRIRLNPKVKVCTVEWGGVSIHLVKDILRSKDVRSIRTMCNETAYISDNWNHEIEGSYHKICKICMEGLQKKYGLLDFDNLEKVNRRHRK